MGEAVEAIDVMARSTHRQSHIALYYAGFEVAGEAKLGKEVVGSDAAAGGEMEVETCTSPAALGSPGDICTLIRVLHGPGTVLSAQVLTLLLRLLALPPAASISAPQLYTPGGQPMAPATTTLLAHLTERLLALEDDTLMQWLQDRLSAGSLATSGAKPVHISAAAAVLNAAATTSGSGSAVAAPASVTGSTAITPWALVSRLVRGLFPVKDSGSTAAASLGERLWSVLRRLLVPAFQSPWPAYAEQLFETLRYLAVATGRVPSLVEVTINLLSDLRQRSVPQTHSGGGGGGSVLGVTATATNSAASAASGPAGSSGLAGPSAGASSSSQAQALWLLLGFLEQSRCCMRVQLARVVRALAHWLVWVPSLRL